MVELRRASEVDCPVIHRIQVKAFAPLLEKYQDVDSNPAAESVAHIERRMAQSFTDYYLISLENEAIGVLRVCDFGEECRISPICILPEFQGNGYAKTAMGLAEAMYPEAKRWTLDTIEQEEKLCRLYESVGYHRTGETRHIKDGMDLVFYEKGV